MRQRPKFARERNFLKTALPAAVFFLRLLFAISLAQPLPVYAGQNSQTTVTEVPPFIGDHSETWEEFGVKKFGDAEISVLDGTATASGHRLETATFQRFFLCGYYAGPSDGKIFMGVDSAGAFVTISFAEPVSAFGAYWDTIPAIPEGCAGKGTDFTFMDAEGNVIAELAYAGDRGGNKWHGYQFAIPVKSILVQGYYLTTDGWQSKVWVANSLANISTRLRVETGDNVPIGGFIITGNAPKNLVLRGIGPSLTRFGITDALADPTLELRDAKGALVRQNDNWQDEQAQASQLTALNLAPENPNESGIVTTLQPGTSYTAILAGKNNGTGTGLVEIYDTNQTATSQLANISTRGFVRTGTQVMIGGFILGGGGGGASVAVRGLGPSLSQSGLSNLLPDPTLELRDANGVLLVANDNWQDDPTSAGQLNTHGLAPQSSLESAVFVSLPSGAFTAILAGKNGGTGIGLVEIYNVQ